MSHQHHHHGDAHGDRAQNQTRLAAVLALTLAYMVAEVVGGYWADSLALLADAGHMFSDAAALALSFFAVWIARRPPTPQHSYGYYRAEILAALANGAALIAISVFIFIEAVERFREPHEVAGPLMIGIAFGGLLVNLAGMALLSAGREGSLNMRGAWLHMLTDALGSIAALAAGACVWAFGWEWADPAASMAIGLLVIYSSWGLLQESISILMEHTPAHLDVESIQQSLAEVPGVIEVHDLHIWTITSGMISLSAHVKLAQGYSSHDALGSIRKAVHDQFGIDHITVQIEPADQGQCRTAF